MALLYSLFPSILFPFSQACLFIDPRVCAPLTSIPAGNQERKSGDLREACSLEGRQVMSPTLPPALVNQCHEPSCVKSGCLHTAATVPELHSKDFKCYTFSNLALPLTESLYSSFLNLQRCAIPSSL